MISKRLGKIVEQCRRITQDTPHDVFVIYSGHVDQIDIDIILGGWRRGVSGKRIGAVYLSEDNAIDGLLKIERHLNVLEHGNLANDYDDMERVA